MKKDWYTVDNIESFDTPALLLYPERIKSNIQQMIESVGDPKRLRPHIKTHKMGQIVQLQLQAGIQKFKCATIAEAELLAQCQVPDILLAYQPVGPKIQRLFRLINSFPKSRFSALVDNSHSAREMAQQAQQQGRVLEVFLDIDNGYHRSGIEPGKEAFDLYQQCLELEGLHPLGLHAYDGHVRISDLEERQALSNRDFDSLSQLILDIEQLIGHLPIIIVGGSPSFPTHTSRLQVECSPGTVLLWDWGYGSRFQDMDYQHAALVVCRIISKPGKDRICVDLGHKAIAADQPVPRVHFLNLTNARQVIHSEEHLVMEVGDNSRFAIGQVLYGVPVHICPTCALYDEALIVEGHQIVKSWTIAARRRRIKV